MPRRNLYLLAAAVLVSAVCYLQADSAYRSRYGRMYETFTDVLEKIDTRYIEKVDGRELFEGAIRGMVAELDDPNSAYYNPHAAALSDSSLKQQFGGIGIEVLFDRQTKQLTIVTPLPNSPAFEAGLLPGDKILEIEDHSTKDMTIDDATVLLRGKPGTVVRLKVLHEDQTEPTDVVVRRAIIKTETVVGYRRTADGSWSYLLPLEPKIAYVRIAMFATNTVEELKAVLERLQSEKIEGLVLDLRNNGGGLLTAAEDVCNMFVRQGVIVTTRGRDGVELSEHKADGSAPFAEVPMAVLINGLSASGSEIVAACLQDHGRATIVGTRSFGKGTVQDVLYLEDGKSQLRLTVASYWRPSGKNIHRFRKAKETDEWGVKPDAGYDVPLDDKQWADVLRQRQKLEAMKRARPAANDANDVLLADPQLERAIDAVREQLAAAAKRVSEHALPVR
jgi:carboxyl-terminal processing protease